MKNSEICFAAWPVQAIICMVLCMQCLTGCREKLEMETKADKQNLQLIVQLPAETEAETTAAADAAGAAEATGEVCAGQSAERDSAMAVTKATIKDEDGIWDLNTWIFDDYGSLVAHQFITYRNVHKEDIQLPCTLLRNMNYSVYVIANSGFDITLHSQSRLKEWRLYINRPEASSRGIPMSGMCSFRLEEGMDLATVNMDRLMAKISVSLDLSELNSNVKMDARSLVAGNCPRSVAVFSPSAPIDSDDLFAQGYSCEWIEGGKLYMLENAGGNSEGDDMRPYVEMHFDYSSDKYISSGGPLIYRFHIKEGEEFKIMRNGHYHITVCPTGNGLGSYDGVSPDDSWRIDTSYLKSL